MQGFAGRARQYSAVAIPEFKTQNLILGLKILLQDCHGRKSLFFETEIILNSAIF